MGRSVASQRNRDIGLHPERQFTSWASQASDAQDARDETNNFADEVAPSVSMASSVRFCLSSEEANLASIRAITCC